MPHWFDIGVNLPDKRLQFDDVVEAAYQQDVLGMLFIGSSVEQTELAINSAKGNENFVVSAGVHPHYAKDVSSDFISELRQVASDPTVVAIGECGLDFNRNFSPQDIQLAVFEQQLQLACELNLPVYLHERDAFDHQVELLAKYANNLKAGVVHCFTGNVEQAKIYVDLGFYIGVTGWVCDPKRGSDLREALSVIPLNRLLLETDSPYLMPKTLKTKSRNNQPANLPHIAKFIAQHKNVDVQDLKRACWRNTMDVFALEFSREV